MSYLITAPEHLSSAATDLASIAATLNAANTSAAVQTTGIAAAAEDEVSEAIAALFSDHAQAFQALNAEAATFHQQFLQALTAGAEAYSGAEAPLLPACSRCSPGAVLLRPSRFRCRSVTPRRAWL